MPYTASGYQALAQVVARVLSYLTRPPTKVIAVDCDETLWRGVAGDEGGAQSVEANIKFMKLLKERKTAAGFLLVTFSKNSEADVKAAFAAHPDWPLAFDDFVNHYVNWEPKSKNMLACAADLKLGLSSFCFIDDNPVEIAEVQANCPDIVTLNIPRAADYGADYVEDYIQGAWPLDAFRTTAADAAKTDQYVTEKQRSVAAQSFTSFADFIESLNLEISISAPEAADHERILQLTQKSNQFNFTTRRLQSMPADLDCLVTRVKDRYGDYGLVGILMFAVKDGILILDNMVMSCRVLGRGVEHRMIAALGAAADKSKASSVQISFADSGKNMPAGNFLQSIDLFPGEGSKAFPAEALSNVLFDPGRVSDYGAKKEGVSLPASDKDLALAARLDFHGIATESCKGPGTAITLKSLGPREGCLLALVEVLGKKASEAAAADGSESMLAWGLDSLKMVRVLAFLKACTTVPDKADATVFFRSATLDGWINILSGNAGKTSASDEVMFQVQKGTNPSLSALVFIHPAGGATGLFKTIWKELGSERAIWAIEHPYFVNEDYHPSKVKIDSVAKLYAKAIAEKLGLPGKKYVLCTFSAGGMWTNETFHQLRLAGHTPDLLLLLDAGWGVFHGPWTCLYFCCQIPCPCYGCCGCCDFYLNCCSLCFRPCQRAQYNARNPKFNPSQPTTWNPPEKHGCCCFRCLKGTPEKAKASAMMKGAYDFFRLGFDGEFLTEKNPVPKQLKMENNPTTVDLSAGVMRKYIESKFGEESGLGQKWERMANVYLNGTATHLIGGYRAVPFDDTPVCAYEVGASGCWGGHPMRLKEALALGGFANNIVDYDDPPVNLKLQGYEEIFAGDPPPMRAHQIVLADPEWVSTVVARFKAVLKKLEL